MAFVQVGNLLYLKFNGYFLLFLIMLQVGDGN